MFRPQDRQHWSIPAIRADEDTLLLADSSGKGMAHYTPPTWRVAAYRGAKVSDLVRILHTSSVPAQISTIIISIGLVDRLQVDTPLLFSMRELGTDLFFLEDAADRKIAVLKLPFVDITNSDLEAGTRSFNEYMDDAFADLGYLVDVPTEFVDLDAAGPLLVSLATAHLN